ncbi:hypothetical protein [Pseudofrankia sp. BMG5.37]|uniref:hypothetical protein n=1 Tax=Pseudofrankia sp. BMG5.37 TaxID=3050035 RepID=UPI002895CF46|nr:hypothetical protein [Pseudofrankia sp. BMG5.37]MDT3443827.1 hypothetical protein [Pseudofrankia sp. BMG5.37]
MGMDYWGKTFWGKTLGCSTTVGAAVVLLPTSVLAGVFSAIDGDGFAKGASELLEETAGKAGQTVGKFGDRHDEKITGATISAAVGLLTRGRGNGNAGAK